MGSSQFTSHPQVIKSIQRGTFTHDTAATLAQTKTITSVDITKSFVVAGFRNAAGANGISLTIELTNATTLTSTIGALSGGNVATWSYQVIEHF